MWECRLVNVGMAEDWMVDQFSRNGFVVLSQESFKYYEKQGIVQGVRQFRFVRKEVKCSACGYVHYHKVKEYF